jgi:N-acetylmuramoyl-L-alanine amidase
MQIETLFCSAPADRANLKNQKEQQLTLILKLAGRRILPKK